MNRLQVSAWVQERSALRYTPAGLPALDLRLAAQSKVQHDGVPRLVKLELRAVAIGQLVASVQTLALGAECVFDGFLAPGRNGKGLVYHLTGVELLPRTA